MCSSKKILYQYFVVFFFYPAWYSFSSENILYVITCTKNTLF